MFSDFPSNHVFIKRKQSGFQQDAINISSKRNYLSIIQIITSYKNNMCNTCKNIYKHIFLFNYKLLKEKKNLVGIRHEPKISIIY